MRVTVINRWEDSQRVTSSRLCKLYSVNISFRKITLPRRGDCRLSLLKASLDSNAKFTW